MIDSPLGSMAGGAGAVQSPCDNENPCILTTFKCVECGRIKQEGNHWFVIFSGHQFSFCPFYPRIGFTLQSRLACSESCLFAQATKFIHREEKK